MCARESNANELPSSFLFSRIRVHTYINARRAGILGNEKERERESASEHTIILGHDESDGDFRFRITSEEEQNIK